MSKAILGFSDRLTASQECSGKRYIRYTPLPTICEEAVGRELALKEHMNSTNQDQKRKRRC